LHDDDQEAEEENLDELSQNAISDARRVYAHSRHPINNFESSHDHPEQKINDFYHQDDEEEDDEVSGDDDYDDEETEEDSKYKLSHFEHAADGYDRLSDAKGGHSFLAHQIISLEHPSTQPLVSVILSAYNNGPFLMKFLGQVFSQTYSNLEVIIVDDSEICLTAQQFEVNVDDPDHLSRIKYKCLKGGRYTVGAKRNLALSSAMGEYVVLWDEHDYFAPNRIWDQVLALNQHGADIVLMRLNHIMTVADDPIVFYSVNPESHPDTVVDTMMVTKRAIKEHDLMWSLDSNGEDHESAFIDSAELVGCKVVEMDAPWVYVLQKKENFNELDIRKEDLSELGSIVFLRFSSYFFTIVYEFYHIYLFLFVILFFLLLSLFFLIMCVGEYPLYWYQTKGPDSFITTLLAHLDFQGNVETIDSEDLDLDPGK